MDFYRFSIRYIDCFKFENGFSGFRLNIIIIIIIITITLITFHSKTTTKESTQFLKRMEIESDPVVHTKEKSNLPWVEK